MNNNYINVGEPTPPRYEFRTFGHSFNEHRKAMEKCTKPVPEDLQLRIFNEVYIISKNIDIVNIKIKNDLLDIKKLIRVKNNVEQWDTVAKHNFPIQKTVFFNDILPSLEADIPVFEASEFDIKKLLNIAKRHKDLVPISAHKKRYSYLINYTICEFAEVIIGNEYLFTVSVESTDLREVITTMNQLNLNSYENINYVQAIKRVKGLVNKPFAN